MKKNKWILAGTVAALALCGILYGKSNWKDAFLEAKGEAGADMVQEGPAEYSIDINSKDEREEMEAVPLNFSANPKLPAFGSQLSDFSPRGWKVMDHFTLDFNKDGIPDYVGVLEHINNLDAKNQEEIFYPRILFAIASQGKREYKLDFQDANLIRTRNEGGIFGDPYNPLTGWETSFTTYSYGGSVHRWSEACTYTYKGGIWYLTKAEKTHEVGPYIVRRSIDDYEIGTGIRKRRSEECEDIRGATTEEALNEEYYDLTYEVKLDTPPLTIFQAGARRQRPEERRWPVKSIEIASGINLKKEQVKHPEEYGLIEYTDENYMIYQFSNERDQGNYLAIYGEQDQSVTVVAEEENQIEDPFLYKGKIYYSCGITEPVSYRDKEGNVTAQETEAGVRLCRINPDGSGPRELFRYRLPELEEGILEQEPPYIALTCEYGGDQIVAEVHIGDRPDLFYCMNLDGSGVRLIGQVPKKL